MAGEPWPPKSLDQSEDRACDQAFWGYSWRDRRGRVEAMGAPEKLEVGQFPKQWPLGHRSQYPHNPLTCGGSLSPSNSFTLVSRGLM